MNDMSGQSNYSSAAIVVVAVIVLLSILSIVNRYIDPGIFNQVVTGAVLILLAVFGGGILVYIVINIKR